MLSRGPVDPGPVAGQQHPVGLSLQLFTYSYLYASITSKMSSIVQVMILECAKYFLQPTRNVVKYVLASGPAGDTADGERSSLLQK